MVMSELEKKLRDDFLKCLQGNSGGNVVDELIGIIKSDYILLARNPVSCRDCFSYNRHNGFPGDWCVYRQEYIRDCSCAVNCEHYLNGEDAARKTMARFKSDLSGEWIIE